MRAQPSEARIGLAIGLQVIDVLGRMGRAKGRSGAQVSRGIEAGRGQAIKVLRLTFI